jgi:CRISPR-associated protein Csb1
MTTIDYKTLHEAVSKFAAAFRAHIELQPAGGPGSKIFPPTYEGGKYATEGPRYADVGGGQKEVSGYDRVLLDSVQSQANRSELALLAAWERGELKLPVITVDFAGSDLTKMLRITSLEAPHRIADALLRDSIHPTEKVAFRKSSVGRALDHVDAHNATALFQHCPTALVFGLWDSTGPKGGLGAKFARAIVSEIVGYDVQVGIKTSSRIDPAQILKEAGPLFRAVDGSMTPFEKDAVKKDGKPVLYGRTKGKDVVFVPGKNQDEGRPSTANHGNVTPSWKDPKTKQPAAGGVIISHAVQTVVLSLTALRRLSFPLSSKRPTPAGDDAARTALAALGLCAVTLAREQNQDLRSRCQLFPTAPFIWELLDEPGTEPKKFTLSRSEALSLYEESLAAAKKAGLPLAEEELVLTPSPQLVELVRRSQQLATSQAEESESEDGGAK